MDGYIKKMATTFCSCKGNEDGRKAWSSVASEMLWWCSPLNTQPFIATFFFFIIQPPRSLEFITPSPSTTSKLYPLFFRAWFFFYHWDFFSEWGLCQPDSRYRISAGLFPTSKGHIFQCRTPVKRELLPSHLFPAVVTALRYYTQSLFWRVSFYQYIEGDKKLKNTSKEKPAGLRVCLSEYKVKSVVVPIANLFPEAP